MVPNQSRSLPEWLLVVVALAALVNCIAWMIRRISLRKARPSDPFRTPPSRESKIADEIPAVISMRTADDNYSAARAEMVKQQLSRRDIVDQRVLAAMGRVPRELFVPDDQRDAAYHDRPLSIGCGQTISQPYIVALMSQLARTRPEAKALDVGTGSGYQAAVLAELVAHVFSIEILPDLAKQARSRLGSLGYENVITQCGDGHQGWPKHAPFDLIIVAAAPDHIPQTLVDQLAPLGRVVIPVGENRQQLIVLEKTADGSVSEDIVAAVAFVPMTGEPDHP